MLNSSTPNRSLKRLLLCLLPRPVLERILTMREPRVSRWNVDVLVSESREAERWLKASPDTYRVVDKATLGDTPSGLVVLPEGEPTGSAGLMLSNSDLGAAVVASTGSLEAVKRASKVGGAPQITPTLIVVREGVLEEVGGAPVGGNPLLGLLERIRDAGHHIGLIPESPPIGGDTLDKGAIDVEGLRGAADTGSPPSNLRSDPITSAAVVILAAVPLCDVGGGSRGAQIALELLRRGYHVTYVNRYDSYEEVDLGLRFIHPMLEQASYRDFDPEALSERVRDKSGLVIVEIPKPEYGEIIDDLSESGWHTIYDVVDDWSDPSLSGVWYDEGYERELLLRSDTVTCSAYDLIIRADKLGRGECALVPNGVNEVIFNGSETEKPDDLPEGRIIGYHGSLYGEWFDWDSLCEVAQANKSSSIVIIGEERGAPIDLPENVTLLGLKPQSELPSYISRFDVGIVPFTVSETTHAVSPLKVFEYLACGVPVAAPPLRALSNLDGVICGNNLVTAVREALNSQRPDPGVALRDHSWSARLKVLSEAAGISLREIENSGALIVNRVTTHYEHGERHVTR